MIAHELETPIAAVRKLNEVLSAGGEDPGVRVYATAATEGELDALTNLVRDVRAVAAVERARGFRDRSSPCTVGEALEGRRKRTRAPFPAVTP